MSQVTVILMGMQMAARQGQREFILSSYSIIGKLRRVGCSEYVLARNRRKMQESEELWVSSNIMRNSENERKGTAIKMFGIR